MVKMLFLILLFTLSTATPQFSQIFQDDMIIESGSLIWGTGEAGSITVSIGHDYYHSDIVEGNWEVIIGEYPLNTHINLSLFFMGRPVQNLYNVIIGRVYVCSGQSNMQFPVSASLFSLQPDNLDYSLLRVTTIDQFSSSHLFTEVNLALPWTLVNDSTKLCGPNNCATSQNNKCLNDDHSYFSAVCLYYGQKISHQSGVYTGLIEADYSGSTIDSWLPGGNHFNPMIYPLLNLKLHGWIWYQGESDAFDISSSMQYGDQLVYLIRSWRSLWFSSTNATFNWIQLHSYTNDFLPTIRWSQTCANDEPNTHWTVAVDIYDPSSPCNEVHPRQKRVIGQRLALTSPTFPTDVAVNGSHISIHFSHLIPFQWCLSPNESFLELYSFETNRWSIIDDSYLTFDHHTLTLPLLYDSFQLRYAWASIPSCILYDIYHSPVAPFWIDCQDECYLPSCRQFPEISSSHSLFANVLLLFMLILV